MYRKALAIAIAVSICSLHTATGAQSPKGAEMPTVWVRYIVSDVDAAIPFYTNYLGFKLDMTLRQGMQRSRAENCSCC